MWKLSCLILLLITIVGCSTHEDTDSTESADTESSRNYRNEENRKFRSEVKKIEYVEYERPDEDDYSRHESEEFQGGKLIGKWRNNGAAFEPKWRDGDSVPLVPFNAAKQTKVGRHDETTVEEGSEYRESSHAVTKPSDRESNVGRATPASEGSVEDTKSGHEDYPPPDNAKKDRHSLDKDYETRYESHEFEGSARDFPSRSKKTRPAALTDDLLYETNAEDSRKPSEDEKIESISSGSRYRDTFQVHPNEYDLNDEEYQKPRPRKRRPPQNYEFSEMRAPTYSVTWRTERYVETTVSPDRPKSIKDPDTTRRRSEKPQLGRRDRNKTSSVDPQRSSENAELKSLLKMQQTEGLSLSELLQRRNLTLNDLLKGKADVINVLKASDSNEDATESAFVKPKIFQTEKVFTTTTSERPRWRPTQTKVKSFDTGSESSTGIKSENDVPEDEPSSKTEDEDSLEHLDSAETENSQRNSNNENEKLSAIVRLTKPIILPRSNSLTEKPTVVTVAPVAKEFVEVYRNQQDDRPVVKNDKSENSDEDEIMEFSDFSGKKNSAVTTTFPIDATTRNVDYKIEEAYEDSGSTLSIENILGTTEQTVVGLPETTQEPDTYYNRVYSNVMEAVSVNYTDMLLLDTEYERAETQEVSDHKSKELAMNEDPLENSENDNTNEASRETATWKNHQVFSTSSKPYEDVISEIEPEARAEIFELFSSGSSAKRLERLLKSRNMSIDELIALRQRGSSKVHMAEVLRAREALAARSRSQNSELIHYTDLKADIIETTEESVPTTTGNDLLDVEMKTATEIPDVTEEPTVIALSETERNQLDFTTQQSNIYSVRTERTEPSSTTEGKIVKHVQLLELLTAFDSLPFSVRPNIEQENVEETKIPSETEDRRVPDDFLEKTRRPDLPTSLVEVGFVEEIAKDVSIPFEEESTEANTKTNYSSTQGEERKNLSKVRPSIIASGAILGVTIVVFLAIFIVCRIRQKQKYTYRNTFSRAVFQAPVMTARKLSNSSSLNTIMVNVVATSTTKRPEQQEQPAAIDDEFDFKSDIENDSLDANDSWDTIPDFMK